MKLTFETFQIFDNIVWKRFYDMKYILLFILTLLLSSECFARQADSFEEIQYPYDVERKVLPNGSTVAYTDQGDGEQTLLLIHGLGSYLPAWTRNIDEFSSRYRVIALDLPGYGKSSKNAEDHTIPFFAETVTQLLDELVIAQTAVAGHSMGGQIALYLAAHSPDRVEKLILTAPAGFEQFSEQDRMAFRTMVSAEGIAGTAEPMIRQNMEANFYRFPPEAEFMIEDRIKMKDLPDFDEYARAQAESIFAMLDEPVADLLPDIQQPTLIVFGNQDALIPNPFLHPDLTVESVAKSGSDMLPNATLKFIDEAGHFVHFEQAPEFNQMVMEFLGE